MFTLNALREEWVNRSHMQVDRYEVIRPLISAFQYGRERMQSKYKLGFLSLFMKCYAMQEANYLK